MIGLRMVQPCVCLQHHLTREGPADSTDSANPIGSATLCRIEGLFRPPQFFADSWWQPPTSLPVPPESCLGAGALGERSRRILLSSPILFSDEAPHIKSSAPETCERYTYRENVIRVCVPNFASTPTGLFTERGSSPFQFSIKKLRI